jgi:predicted DNA-binding transcriptional regulator YafY
MARQKLTEDDKRLIHELHAWKMAEVKRVNEIASGRALADKFGVSVRCIERVLSR